MIKKLYIYVAKNPSHIRNICIAISKARAIDALFGVVGFRWLVAICFACPRHTYTRLIKNIYTMLVVNSWFVQTSDCAVLLLMVNTRKKSKLITNRESTRMQSVGHNYCVFLLPLMGVLPLGDLWTLWVHWIESLIVVWLCMWLFSKCWAIICWANNVEQRLLWSLYGWLLALSIRHHYAMDANYKCTFANIYSKVTYTVKNIYLSFSIIKKGLCSWNNNCHVSDEILKKNKRQWIKWRSCFICKILF